MIPSLNPLASHPLSQHLRCKTNHANPIPVSTHSNRTIARHGGRPVFRQVCTPNTRYAFHAWLHAPLNVRDLRHRCSSHAPVFRDFVFSRFNELQIQLPTNVQLRKSHQCQQEPDLRPRLMCVLQEEEEETMFSLGMPRGKEEVRVSHSVYKKVPLESFAVRDTLPHLQIRSSEDKASRKRSNSCWGCSPNQSLPCCIKTWSKSLHLSIWSRRRSSPGVCWFLQEGRR
jgi:hypothetical protein